jgi:hypothetical protein
MDSILDKSQAKNKEIFENMQHEYKILKEKYENEVSNYKVQVI